MCFLREEDKQIDYELLKSQIINGLLELGIFI